MLLLEALSQLFDADPDVSKPGILFLQGFE
jgi:hypothetical protein